MKKMLENKQIFSKFKNLLLRLVYIFNTISTYKKLLILYLFVTFLGAVILMIPISQTGDINVGFMDALFISASAFSDTGLVSLDTHETWSYFGQAIIAILILNGGIGIFSLKIYIINILFGRPISYNTNLVLTTERGSVKAGSSKSLIKVSITILFILILLFSLILTIYFYFSPIDLKDFPGSVSPFGNWGTSFRFGLFHTISAINNAGFDIIGPDSLSPYYFNYGIQFMFMILFIIGGIGYPVISDIYFWVKTRFTKEHFTWSLFTKISMVTYLILSFLGIGLVFIYEMTLYNEANSIWMSKDPRFGSNGDKIMAFIFNTMSTRNAGFSTVSMYDLSFNTNFVYIILMFIGSAPSSTAGGIRTTTIAIAFLGLWGQVRGRNKVRAFRSTIEPRTVERSYIIFLTSIFLVVIVASAGITSFKDYGGKLNTPDFLPINSGSFLALPNSGFSFISLVFEAASAFGTTGLSLGITRGLSISGKIFLIMLMFIGQLGLSATILLWGRRNSRAKRYDYVTKNVVIG